MKSNEVGVFIKGFKMPSSCCDCDMIELSGAIGCRHAYDMKNSDFDRASDCPLVPVQPHGRLIDADALIEDLERQCKEVFRIDAVSPNDYWITRNEAYNEALWKSWVESFGEYLKTRPTIIPAEEGV